MGNNLNIVTSNEHNDLTQWKRRQDVAAIYAEFPSTEPIVLWQEIKHPEHHVDIDERVPPGTQHLFRDLPIPITVPHWFEIVSQFSVQTKENTVEHYETGKAPRWYAIAELRDTRRPDLPTFCVANTHLTNGCDWDDKRLPLDPANPTPEERADEDLNAFLRPYWLSHHESLMNEISLIAAWDLTVFYGGDFNRKVGAPALNAAEKVAVGEGLIDKIAVVEGSVTALLKATGVIETHSDHQARWARWELAARA